MNRLQSVDGKHGQDTAPSTNGCNGHASKAPPADSAALAAEAGRDSAGRFTKGNRGGPGNPFARQVAGLRSALLAAITPEQMQKLTVSLYERALRGNMPAAALLLRYTLGNPAPVVDPDRLDLEAFRLVQQYPDWSEAFGLSHRLDPAAALAHAESCKPRPIDMEGEADA
jgi:hypothetical protein